MKQYFAAKARYPRHLLFFRVGDFYEMFYDDAKTAARALGLTLTSRNKGPDPIPMAGVPAHSCEPYIARLLRQGFAVAVCDQTEDASQAKGLVKRDVTRVVTPGTVLEDNLLEPRKPNRIVAILPEPLIAGQSKRSAGFQPAGGEAGRQDACATFGLAAADLTSGTLYVQELKGSSALRSELARLSPTECLLPEGTALPFSSDGIGASTGASLSYLKEAAFVTAEAHGRIMERFAGRGTDKPAVAALKALLRSQPLGSACAGALVGYIDETFAGGKVMLSAPAGFDPDKFLALGESAIRSLELTETLRSRSFEGSLLWAIDQTCTGGGSRLLREWLIRPLRDLILLQARHDAVGTLFENFELRGNIRTQLKSLADLERIAARLIAGKALPRDLLALRESLLVLPSLHELLDSSGPLLSALKESARSAPETSESVGLLMKIRAQLSGFETLAELIRQQLKSDCSNTLHEGGLINTGVDPELDRLHAISTGGKEWITAFEKSEGARSGINSLKVGYNRVFGYYIEISHANKAKVPADYERRQTLTNAERYTTPELKSREAEVLGAEEKICILEQKLFLKLRACVAESAPALHACGGALAQLDVLCSLSEVAHKKNHVRPVLNNSGRLVFEQMRHPVLEETLPKGELVPNDLTLIAPVNGRANGESARNGASRPATPAQIVILSGPNMAGKSTYIRATALCTILAQMGAFVPAERAEVGLVDRIFTRVGAADDLAGGRSTFMVEMVEVAEILAACSDRSLLILDEVGRGTSTYDGVSLAWALIEHLHQGTARPRTLFATHYHELAALSEELPRVQNASASVKEWQGEITFLHRIVPGPSERSFGIHVARLAGLPDQLITRAKAILQALEEQSPRNMGGLTDGGAQVGSDPSARRKKKLEPKTRDGQLSLFEPDEEMIDPLAREVLDALRTTDPQRLTPLDALALLDKLARLAQRK